MFGGRPFFIGWAAFALGASTPEQRSCKLPFVVGYGSDGDLERMTKSSRMVYRHFGVSKNEKKEKG